MKSPDQAARAEASQIVEAIGDEALGVPATWPPPEEPMAVARRLLDDGYQHHERPRLLRWRGQWMTWTGQHWGEAEHDVIRSYAYESLEHAFYEAKGDDGETKYRKWQPNRSKIADVLEALAAICQLSGEISPPAWLTEPAPVPAGPVVACVNGLMHARERKLYDLTPNYFTLVSVPFAYSPEAPEPERWIGFLNQLWPDDPDSIALLQDWFGYVISGRTDLHKILALIGPTRSGKGTIARVISALMGSRNVAGPTLASLGSQFGLAPLLGKPLAIISDARLGRDNERAVVERLLSISGEDMLSIDRKYREAWTGTLPTRLMILSNELPRFGDASGAIADRFAVLRLTQSWLGHEDSQLTSGLLAELPGILNWSLDGLARLDQSGRFKEPGSSADAAALLHEITSPISKFIGDCCITHCVHNPRCVHEVVVDDLYIRYKEWCDTEGLRAESKSTWSRNMWAAVPGMKRARASREWQPAPGSLLPLPGHLGGGGRPWLWRGIRFRQAEWPDDPEDDDQDKAAGTPIEITMGDCRGPSWTSSEPHPGLPAETGPKTLVHDYGGVVDQTGGWSTTGPRLVHDSNDHTWPLTSMVHVVHDGPRWSTIFRKRSLTRTRGRAIGHLRPLSRSVHEVRGRGQSALRCLRGRRREDAPRRLLGLARSVSENGTGPQLDSQWDYYRPSGQTGLGIMAAFIEEYGEDNSEQIIRHVADAHGGQWKGARLGLARFQLTEDSRKYFTEPVLKEIKDIRKATADRDAP